MRLDLYAEGGYSGGGITENGGNISGPLLLAGNPSQTLEAVPKQYVDAYYNSINAGNLTAGTLHAERLPNFTGDLQSSPGTTQLTLNNSGVTPGEYSKVTVNAKGIVTGGSNINDSDIPFGLNWSKINPGTLPSTLSGYGITDGVSVNGATMLGFLTLSNGPTIGTHAATKQYVDSLVSGGGIAIGDILRKPYSTTPAGFLKCNGAEADKTTYASLYSIIGDNYKNTNIAGSGQPWNQQYQINLNQSPDISSWATEATGLPNGLYYSSAVVTKNRVYLLGGRNGVYTNAVLTAPINADGTLGTWVAGTYLPNVLALAQPIVTKNRLYLIGGYTDNDSTTSVVYTAAINADGTLGAWGYGSSLPANIGSGKAFITKNRVYFCGGANGLTGINYVYTAPISSDGIIGTWSTDVSLPVIGSGLSAVITKNRVYLLAGFVSNVIYSAIINSDGTLGTWTLDSNTLPYMVSASHVVVTKNVVYLIAGWGSSIPVNTICKASINADGTLGTWVVISDTLPGINAIGQSIVVKNKVYILGGNNGSGAISSIYSATINGGLNDYSAYYSEDTTNYLMPGSGKPWQQQYQINQTQSANITGWTLATALPIGLGQSPIVVTKNRVYILGGYSAGTTISAIYSATINSDGTLGTWGTNSSLPVNNFGSQAVVFKNKVYLLGGYNGSAAVATVYRTSINADGTLGSWVTETSMPVALNGLAAVITKNRIYVIGGHNGSSYVSTTHSANINSDGTLGSWVAGTTIPEQTGSVQTFITKNRIYIYGGYTTSAWIAGYTATINSDGFIGIWTLSSNLPGALGYNQSIVTKNRVYLLGGNYGSTGSTVSSNIYSAPINDDGTLGTWVTSGNINTVIYASCGAFIANNKVYILGGYAGPGNPNSLVQMATISEGLNDYSPYYDGTVAPAAVPDSSTKFILPDLSGEEHFGSYSYIKY